MSLCSTLFVCAQQKTRVWLNEVARDDKFDRINMNFAVFELTNDTILTWDFEGTKEAKPLAIKKPAGYRHYGYGYLWFGANKSGKSPGMLTILIGNPYDKNPAFIADVNNNNDFTDDSIRYLPWRNDSVEFNICLSETQVCNKVKFTRHPYNGKFAYKELMNEFYAMNYPNRKFLGMEHCYREQHYQTKAGYLVSGNDSFRIALYDANNNGFYNEADTDYMVVAHLNDTVFYPFDDLYSSIISRTKGNCFIDKNGSQFTYITAAAQGEWLEVEINDQTTNDAQVKLGKKLPKFKYVNWKGEKGKLKPARKMAWYIYFGSPLTPTFTEDTAYLRKLRYSYNNKLMVIGFIEFSKSYELSVFGQFGKPNWILANKDKYLNKSLGIKGLPSSILTYKKRRVRAYHLSPKEVFELLSKEN